VRECPVFFCVHSCCARAAIVCVCMRAAPSTNPPLCWYVEEYHMMPLLCCVEDSVCEREDSERERGSNCQVAGCVTAHTAVLTKKKLTSNSNCICTNLPTFLQPHKHTTLTPCDLFSFSIQHNTPSPSLTAQNGCQVVQARAEEGEE
jgi:hypothetical protein